MGTADRGIWTEVDTKILGASPALWACLLVSVIALVARVGGAL